MENIKKLVNIDTGEVCRFLEVTNINTIHNQKKNKNKFVKIYTQFLPVINTCSMPEIKLLFFIFEHLKPNKELITLDANSTNTSRSKFNATINKLINKNIIYKTNIRNIYKINAQYFFNGSNNH